MGNVLESDIAGREFAETGFTELRHGVGLFTEMRAAVRWVAEYTKAQKRTRLV